MKQCIFLIIVFSLISQRTTSNIPLLSHTVSAKRLAQGNARGAFDRFFPNEYNPAFLGIVEKNSFSINKQEWIDDVSFLGMNMNYLFNGLNSSVNLKYNSVSDIAIRGDVPTQNDMGRFNTYSAILSFSLAKEVISRLYLGVSYEMIREKQFLNEYSGRSYDLGALYRMDFMDVYASFENSGSLDIPETTTPIYLPKTMTIGGRKSFGSVNLGIEIQNVRSNYSEHLFADVVLNRYLSLSGGYVFNDETLSWTTGLMFNYRSIYLLLSYAAHDKLKEYKLLQFSIEL